MCCVAFIEGKGITGLPEQESFVFGLARTRKIVGPAGFPVEEKGSGGLSGDVARREPDERIGPFGGCPQE